MSPRGWYIVHKKNGQFGGNERREREKTACVWDGKTEKRGWDCKDGEKERGVIQHLLLPDSFHLHYCAPEQLILLFFSRKCNNVPQVKELSQLFSSSAKLTLSTKIKVILENRCCNSHTKEPFPVTGSLFWRRLLGFVLRRRRRWSWLCSHPARFPNWLLNRTRETLFPMPSGAGYPWGDVEDGDGEEGTTA